MPHQTKTIVMLRQLASFHRTTIEQLGRDAVRRAFCGIGAMPEEILKIHALCRDGLNDILHHLGIDPYGSKPRGQDILKRGGFGATFPIGSANLTTTVGITHWYADMIRCYRELLGSGTVPIRAESGVRMNLLSMEALALDIKSEMPAH